MEIKHALDTAPVLVHPQEGSPWVVAIDVNLVGLHDVLMHEHPSKLRPIAFDHTRFQK